VAALERSQNRGVDRGKREDIAKEGANGVSLLRVDECVNADDHRDGR